MNDKREPRWIATKIFVAIARDAIAAIDAAEPQFDRIDAQTRHEPTVKNLDAWSAVHNPLLKHACTAIIFAGAALEAYINDYGARRLSGAILQTHLDKLSLVAKWVVIPRMITGNGLPEGEHWFELLGQAVRSRNRLVHFKSGHGGEQLEIRKLIGEARTAVAAVEAAARQIEQLDPTEAPDLQLG